MTTKPAHDKPILVTGAAGDVGGIGRNVTAMLLAKGHRVRAMVRREDARAEALRQLGAEVIQGDLTDLNSMHRAIEGCARIYFGMSVSTAYLEATVNTAAVARHHGVEAFVNMSQMTVTQMSITETTDSPQHKLHWLSEQALAWSELPVVTVRLNAQGRYDRMTDDLLKLTGEAPMSMRDFVKLHAAEFTPRANTA
jgi:uncharacterized protein YbjT (DUF2867 family)